MEIKTKSIKDISDQFIDLKKEIDKPDYTVFFEGFLFNFTGEHEVNIDNLQFLFNSDDIKGVLAACSVDDIKNEINGALTCNIDYRLTEKEQAQEAVKILDLFWSIIHKYISFSSIKIYRHIPDEDSYFSEYLVWGFCYVLLNEQKGLVIAVDTSD